MMASSRSIFLPNLAELTDIDIDMEVKSEHDSDDGTESNANVFDNCSGFDVEFIIPERQNPDENVSLGSGLQSDSVSDLSQDDSDGLATSFCESDEYVEDEPEVEIDEVTVQQELVEVDLDPSLLLYVKRDKKPAAQSHSQQQNQQQEQLSTVLPPLVTSDLLKESFNQSELEVEPQKSINDVPVVSSIVFSNQDDFSSFLIPNRRNGSSGVTAALRKVKRKLHREPLEPLNEIESSSNVDNSNNIENKLACKNENIGPNLDNTRRTYNDDNDGDDDVGSDNNVRDTYSDQQSVSGSDSESKEQRDVSAKSPIVTKRRRGRPRLKPLEFLDRICIKRKNRNIKVRKKTKIKLRNNKSKKFNRKRDLTKENQDNVESSSVIENNAACDLYSDCENENLKCIETDGNPSEDDYKKERKQKKDKKKPSIFDEVKMEYTVLNESQPNEKPKRIRKRDKKSRELAALSKPDSFDCTECGRKFKEKSHLATHARAHINVRNFKCNRCGNLFKTKTSLFFHMKTHSDAPFTCEKCNKTYPERRMLMRHIRVVHSCTNLYSCDQCGREFKSMNNLNLHYTLHTGVKPFTCNICGKSFVYKSTYVAHMKGHDADNSFNCELCPKTYSNKAEFRRLCNHHSEARPWLCTVCGKGYPLKGTLKNHMRTHEPEKPFKCTDCPKSFMKKQSFECHIKIHAGERPQFMCDQCSQSYFTVFALKRHYLKHTSERRFVCQVCSKAFWMKDALKVHMRTHSSVKMFPCSHCPKAFAHKHTLDAHSRTHLDVLPYSCNVCQKTFIHKYNLARHERQHLLTSSMPVMPSLPMVPPELQPMPISVMMLPPMPSSPTTTTLHIL